jgi:hypothetical protein
VNAVPKKRRHAPKGLCVALLALTGCEDPLKDAQLLEEERVLAVRLPMKQVQ